MSKRRNQRLYLLLVVRCRSVKCTAMLNKIKFLNFLKPFAKVFDVLFSLLVVAPLVITYWFSIWKCFDIFISPEDQKISTVISFVIGFSGQFILIYFQKDVAKVLKFEKHKLLNAIASKIYSVLFAATCISLWRGLWKFADFTSPADNYTIIINIIQNSVIMMISKTFKSSVSSPFVVTTDPIENDYKVSTYFKTVVN